MNDFKFSNRVPNMLPQPYQIDYLPTAMDESLSLLQKVNMLIQMSNAVNTNFNDIVKKWNELVEWVTGKGLHDELQKIINKMLQDGVFGDFFLSLPKNVRYYGAMGDGVTDDTDAIKAAVKGGGVIYVPQGQYKITDTIIVKSDTTFEMHPKARIRLEADAYTAFQTGEDDDCGCRFGYDGEKNIKFIGGTIDCGGSETSGIRSGIFLGHNSNVLIEGVHILNVKEAHHIEINASQFVTVRKSRFGKFFGGRTFSEAIQIDGAFNAEVFPPFGEYDDTVCRNILIEDCRFEDCGAGIGTHNAKTLLFHETIRIENCEFYNMKSHLIRMFNFKESTVRSIKGNGDGAGILMTGCYEVTLDDIRIADMGQNGISIENSTYVNVTNGTVKRTAVGVTVFGGSSNVYIDGLRIESTKNNGVVFNGVSKCKIYNTSINSATGLGVYLLNATDCTLDDVYIDGSTGSALNLTTSNNNYFKRVKVTNPVTGSTAVPAVNVLSGNNNEFVECAASKGSGVATFGLALNSNAGSNNRFIDNTFFSTAFAQVAYVVEKEWRTLDLSNGWSNVSSNYPARYKLNGDTVILNGLLNLGTLGGSDSDSNKAGQIVPLAAPKQAQFKVAGGIGGGVADFARINIYPSGRIAIPVANGLTSVDLNTTIYLR
ncbi:tail spike protein [Bacillus phage Karezi]|uniref:Pre-neck appendage protein n=1 Tax=Bacillus phage Karezi TaxID=2591398 RepID=A0A514AAN8_9CAUD|nr:tail spike protein [Bacillus phage Karezi]QDH50341.1 pre-neck appendage protein [Bacillus phage Karezi]